MNLALNPEEASELRAALGSYLSDLGMEIADTDDRTFRLGLHRTRDALTRIVAKLDDTTPTPPTPA